MTGGGFSVLITGANRGIGIGLVRAFLARSDLTHLFAGARKPEEAKVYGFDYLEIFTRGGGSFQELTAIKDDRLHIIALDATSDDSIQAAKTEVSNVLGAAGLNLLINNAGIFVPYPLDVPDRKKVHETLDVNTVGTLIVSQIFFPLLKQAADHFASRPVGITRAAIVNITSDWGSIANSQGSVSSWNSLTYRAALNQLTKTLSIDWKDDNIFIVGIHPGWVRTDMGGEGGALSIDESAQSIQNTISVLTAKDTGGYLDWTGKPMAY